MRCASCGSPAADGARFCDQCGAPLRALGSDPGATAASPITAMADGARPDPRPGNGDRRVVTALFADLVDYVRMLAEHDPEEVRSRVTAALDTMADAIAKFGGTREKFIGDAVFAVFGWPRAHDDDAVRAALAAMEIRRRLAGTDGVEPMEVRVGIATGEVVAAASDPGHQADLSLTGEAITTAARIQSLARPGEILLDGETQRAARDRLAVDARGSVVLRGQSTSIQLFSLRGEAGRSAWTLHPAVAPGPLVGRVGERRRLGRLLERLAVEGRGGIALVVGDAGVGKSRLLAAMESEARALGFAWTWTENVSYGRDEPYRYARLFAQTVADEHGLDSGTLARRMLFADAAPEDVARLSGAIAAIARDARFSGWEAESAFIPNDPTEVAVALLEVASRYIEALMVSAGPRVVIIDDLHWLDPSSVGMVELLAETTARHPLVLIAGTRPGEMPSWADRLEAVRVDLPGLREPESAQLATHVARAALDADGARTIHERTGGNPLFVAETVRASLEDGTLAWRDGRVALVEGGVPRLPLTLRAVLGARIDALDPEARDVLGVASVIGIGFDAATVGELVGGPPAAPEVLDRLAEAALIAPAEDGEWRFAHGLIRDAAYAGLLAIRRRTLHARMADLLESRSGPGAVGTIASHRASAGDLAQALPLLREAAAAAMTLGAAEEAAAFWRRSAEFADTTDPDGARRDRELAQDALERSRSLREAAGLDAAVERP